MDAAKAIKDIYSIEDLKEIADHGCQSGVCSQHIYYGDTIKFFDNYEDEIMDELVLNYGTEFLIELFKDADAVLSNYKNNATWAFIELIASEAVADHNYEYAQANADLAPAKMLDEWNNSFELYQSSPTWFSSLMILKEPSLLGVHGGRPFTSLDKGFIPLIHLLSKLWLKESE